MLGGRKVIEREQHWSIRKIKESFIIRATQHNMNQILVFMYILCSSEMPCSSTSLLNLMVSGSIAQNFRVFDKTICLSSQRWKNGNKFLSKVICCWICYWLQRNFLFLNLYSIKLGILWLELFVVGLPLQTWVCGSIPFHWVCIQLNYLREFLSPLSSTLCYPWHFPCLHLVQWCNHEHF